MTPLFFINDLKIIIRQEKLEWATLIMMISFKLQGQKQIHQQNGQKIVENEKITYIKDENVHFQAENVHFQPFSDRFWT